MQRLQFEKHQWLVLKLIAAGTTLLIAIAASVWALTQYTIVARLLDVPAFSVLLLASYALPLLIFSNIVVFKRFNDPDLIMGAYCAAEESIRVEKALLQNTLEQTVITFPLGLCAFLLTPGHWASVLPMHVSLFLAGRLLFALGYYRHWALRIPGFVIGNYANLLMIPACIGMFATSNPA